MQPHGQREVALARRARGRRRVHARGRGDELPRSTPSARLLVQRDDPCERRAHVSPTQRCAPEPPPPPRLPRRCRRRRPPPTAARARAAPALPPRPAPRRPLPRGKAGGTPRDTRRAPPKCRAAPRAAARSRCGGRHSCQAPSPRAHLRGAQRRWAAGTGGLALFARVQRQAGQRLEALSRGPDASAVLAALQHRIAEQRHHGSEHLAARAAQPSS